MEKAETALKSCGYSSLTPFQRQVIPSICSGKDLAAETETAVGKTAAYLLPLIIRPMPKKTSPSALVVTDSPESVNRISHSYKMLVTANRQRSNMAALGSDGNAGSELALIKTKPAIIVGTASRIIDHIRRNNFNLKATETMIIEMPDGQDTSGFQQDIIFIASKLKKRVQKQIYLNSIDHIGELNNLLAHPHILLSSDRKTEIDETKGEHTVDTRKTEEKIQAIIDKIKSDPDKLSEYRKIVRKKVPFFMRSYFAAWLLMNSDKPGKGIPVNAPAQKENMKTLFVSIGKNRRVYPGDLVKLFQKKLDTGSSSLGNIKVLDNYSFVDIDSSLSDKAVSLMNGMEYRGRKISVDFARKKSG